MFIAIAISLIFASLFRLEYAYTKDIESLWLAAYNLLFSGVIAVIGMYIELVNRSGK